LVDSRLNGSAARKDGRFFSLPMRGSGLIVPESTIGFKLVASAGACRVRSQEMILESCFVVLQVLEMESENHRQRTSWRISSCSGLGTVTGTKLPAQK
jgi:hypothetical protein